MLYIEYTKRNVSHHKKQHRSQHSAIKVYCVKSLHGCDGSQSAISVTVPVITQWGEHITAHTHIAYTEIQISYKNSKQTYGE